MGNYRDRSKWRFDGTIRAAFLREFVGTPLLGGSIDGNPMLTFMSSNVTITPAITLSGDGPCQWEVTEGDGTKYYYSANSFSHTRSVAGNMTVRLLNTLQVAPYVTVLDCSVDGIISSIDTLQLKLFVNMQQIRLGANSIYGNLRDSILASGLTFINLSSNRFTGIFDIVQYNNVTTIHIGDNLIAEDLSAITLPTTANTVYLYTNQLTGFYTIPNPSAIRDFQAQNQGATNMTQPRIDAFVTDVYSKRAGFTYVTPSFNIGGTNANPSGIYQNPFPNPPATPLEMIYVLVNDPFTEGFNKQVWTY